MSGDGITEKLLLSADGDIALYEVEKKIFNDLDCLIEEFFKWKKTNSYDEKLFVKFMQQKFGNEAVKFIKKLGCFDNSSIPKEYESIKWINF